jgi:hypothetical protein
MPAVQLERLRSQLNDLAWKFTQPQIFQAGLIDLMETYADRVYRPGQALGATQLLPRYHLPPLFRRELELMLTRHCAENPQAGLALADLMWKSSVHEPRQVAAYLLGLYPIEVENAIPERLNTWAQPDVDGGLLASLFELGGRRLRSEQPDRWLNLLRDWLEREEPAWQRLGLSALTGNDRDFVNLPAVFNLLTPFLNHPAAAFQGELESILAVLQRRSAVETAYMLRQILVLSGTERLERIVRSMLASFPPEQQETLRQALKNRPSAQKTSGQA